MGAGIAQDIWRLLRCHALWGFRFILLAERVTNIGFNSDQFAQSAHYVFGSAEANAVKSCEQMPFEVDGKAKVSNDRIGCGMEMRFHCKSAEDRPELSEVVPLAVVMQVQEQGRFE
ncbi:hypothetical protein [Collinsella stercoris]|uniref:Uncharacterized protein n=1 Tax=Collinsella stercoris DSM 13279 TaxID=445975 RepID=B6G8K8_9ACTN|nr:hypothetical protein [Collinsella stercoris]EEA91393.1 hypothetical protein COLSTE_00399 [Collinsella stercoris DSM 13279]UEA44738.1 hypothetical protein LK434_06180 [Collinsella stercoris DSM 13279]UWP10795.1 hypothetical protein NQ498_05825 [Collinsella stercoris]